MNNMEFNKVFAAILVAGIIASFSGFLAEHLVHPHELSPDHFAYAVEGVADGGVGGAAKEALPEPILALIGAADIERGKQVAKACAACHSFDKGGPNGTGPNLWNIVNRATAGSGGFAYSQALKDHGGKWDYLALNKYLWKPKWFIPGNNMNFIGVKKPDDRAALIAYLRTLSDSPAALPAAGAIEAETAELAPPPAEAEETTPEAAPAAAH